MIYIYQVPLHCFLIILTVLLFTAIFLLQTCNTLFISYNKLYYLMHPKPLIRFCLKHYLICYYTCNSKCVRKNCKANVYIYTHQNVMSGEIANTQTLSISSEAKQGSVISPLLFSIYIDNLVFKLKQLGDGLPC